MTDSTVKGRLIGYARVSTEDQATDAQVDALKAAGCAVIFREHMSGAKAARPELAKALARVQRGCRFPFQDGIHPLNDFNEMGETEVP